jgi:uncharacterized LabA/DUF88 family protein
MRGMRAAIFIDGAYFDWVLRDELNFARIDYQKFSHAVAGDIEILRTYYYHCEPYLSNPPSPEETSKFQKMQSFFRYLQQLPRYEVRLGKLAYQGKNAEDGRPIVEQKRVDILLGVDLVLLAAKQMITHAILVAGDSDFLPAIEVARNEGVLVHLYHGVQNSPHRELWDKCDERTPITPALIRSL